MKLVLELKTIGLTSMAYYFCVVTQSSRGFNIPNVCPEEFSKCPALVERSTD
ncbi:hypothetical protein Mapa_003711 [Marchantia paleacea]|nr:hypothetical protein Mapa_003711 [Marchantia paleacea]